jgi:hypothetical protein
VQSIAEAEDPRFFALFQKVFAWKWRDQKRAADYGQRNEIPGFDIVALPQGLVASGFFANVAIYLFGSAIRDYFDRPIDAAGDFILKDACYYVDDLRLVFLTKPETDESDIEAAVADWLQGLLDQHATGLKVERSKTKATVGNRDKRFLVQQSKAAEHIQRQVSAGFDMLHGSELIGAIDGFFHTQKRYPAETGDDGTLSSSLIVGTSDMRDDTAARFAAGKYRRTFRSLRPLLENDNSTPVGNTESSIDEADDIVSRQLVLSKQQLDERGHLFSGMLIEEWVRDPSNVRLLRIALDLCPDFKFLDKILKLLEPGWKDGGSRGANREVRLYCLAEIFRAGATETGMVSDQECLPGGLDVNKYHERLRKEAVDVLLASAASPLAKKRFPWYLLQQIMLYLAAQNYIPKEVISSFKLKQRELARYQRFVQFLAGRIPTQLQERAIYLILAYSAFGHMDVLQRIASSRVSAEFLRAVCEISPKTAQALWLLVKDSSIAGQQKMARSLGLEQGGTNTTSHSLAELVVRDHNPLSQEDNLLELALGLLKIGPGQWPDLLTPWQVQCEVVESHESTLGTLKASSIVISNIAPRASRLFSLPSWCESQDEKHRFQLGMLLRFALRGSVDFYSSNFTRRTPIIGCYRLPVSHWEKQRYAMFQGRTAFGQPWIPISSWVENFLFDLLRWPGSGSSSFICNLSEWIGLLEERIQQLSRLRGSATKMLFLEQTAPWPDRPPKEWQRPLRIGIVQSVIPCKSDYEQHLQDPELLDRAFRVSQRRHLASVMESVIQMLRLRETHQSMHRSDGRVIDLLIFPELAVHPLDIETIILPFVRTHKCMALFGQVYHRASCTSDAPLINSCLWMIPEWTPEAGFQVKLVEQGKAFLTQEEMKFNPQPSSFRPAQWIIEYPWTSAPNSRPLRLSASICFDATDLALASDLKSRNDVYIVCALNKDVGTFDRMSEDLHYHMYQAVVVVNNGQFGGSCFYMPFRDPFHRQVFHLHGQPQATIAFAEISPEELINRPNPSSPSNNAKWKTPPANWNRI